MRIGVTIHLTDQTISPVELAREAEARGFASLFFPEHTHIPISRATPAPTGEPELPERYLRTLDPFVSLSAAAGVTSRILLGTGVFLPAQREPISTAKTIATLDHLSGGRVILGAGFNWNREEVANHGVDPRHRRAIAREHVLAMRALWENDVACYDGKWVRFEPSWQWPKPLARPPILLGGAAGPTLFSHIAEYGDGWLPIGGGGVREALPRLYRAAEEAGRDPATLRVIPFGVQPTKPKLDYYASLGIEHVVLGLPTGDAGEVLRALDAFANEFLQQA